MEQTIQVFLLCLVGFSVALDSFTQVDLERKSKEKHLFVCFQVYDQSGESVGDSGGPGVEGECRGDEEPAGHHLGAQGEANMMISFTFIRALFNSC